PSQSQPCNSPYLSYVLEERSEIPGAAHGDFNGNGTIDSSLQLGLAGDVPVPGDWNFAWADETVWRLPGANWFVENTSIAGASLHERTEGEPLMADGTALEVPADLAQIAEEKGIPLDLVRRGLALGFPADAIKGQLGMPGVTAEAAEQFISEQERIRAGGEITIPQELLE